MWGNLQFEYSQMLAAVGRPWKAVLDEAVGRFRAAGCPEADIRQALSQHTQAEHIDLGPEPTLEAPPVRLYSCYIGMSPRSEGRAAASTSIICV